MKSDGFETTAPRPPSVAVGHQVSIMVGDREVATLADILPDAGPMRMLIVGKTPAPVSVAAGHYFQGRHGQLFWGKLREHGILGVAAGEYEDDALVAHGLGITDVVKEPRPFGQEPSADEYRAGVERLLATVARLRPRVVLFVYKRALDQVLAFAIGRATKGQYGFNPDLDSLFGARVFAFPMPGTPVRREAIRLHMQELAAALQ